MRAAQQKQTIIKDRVEIYKDFAINLLNYIYEYYIDKESLNDDEDIYNHYSWCFNKVCDEFNEENINFKENKELKEYYYSYYYHQFYRKETQHSLKVYKSFWNNIFEIDNQKNMGLLNLLIEAYVIYDKSINSEKNILELV